MTLFRRHLLLYVLDLAFERPSDAAGIPRSGKEGELVDCFTTRCTLGDGRELILLNRNGSLLSALAYDGSRFSVDTVVLLDELIPDRVEVRHYYGLDTITYSGSTSAALGLFTKWPYVKVWVMRAKNYLAQSLFNRRSMVVRTRSQILSEVVQLAEAGSQGVTSLDIMSSRHGYRWAGHPGWEYLSARIDFHLERLAESGELRKVTCGYEPTGLALKVLEETDEHERRHRESMKVQIGLGFLAFMTAIMAGAQAGLIKLPTVIDLTTAVEKTERSSGDGQ